MLFSAIIFLASVSASPKSLESLRTTFANKKSFEVDFTQEIKQEVFPDQKNKAAGHVKFERPNRLVWKYTTPTKRTIEYDGKELKIEENSKTEVVRDSGQTNLQESFSFLWGQPNPQIFSIESKDASTFRVTPKNAAKAGFKFIDVSVKKGLVAEARVRDHFDGDSILQFQNWKIK